MCLMTQFRCYVRYLVSRCVILEEATRAFAYGIVMLDSNDYCRPENAVVLYLSLTRWTGTFFFLTIPVLFR